VSVNNLKIFLCHSSGDKELVRVLYKRLIRDGFNVWLDEINLLPGQDWDNEIKKAVRVSDVVIVCLSRGSVRKDGYIQKEIKLALDVADEKPEDTIFVIPLKLEDCDVPTRLAKWQYVEMYQQEGYERLKASLGLIVVGATQFPTTNDLQSEVLGTTGVSGTVPPSMSLPVNDSVKIQKRKPSAGDNKSDRIISINTRNRGCIFVVILIALIMLTVGYWQFIYQPSHKPGEPFTYATLIQDANSHAVIRGAKVTIYVENLASLSEITDNNGYARFQIPATHSGRPGRLKVEMKEYAVYDMAIDLVPSRLPSVISLDPQ
jgi:TIR domain